MEEMAMSSWKSADACPPPPGETVLLRGRLGRMYVGWAYKTSYGATLYKVPGYCGNVRPVWWCPIPEFDGEEGR